MTKLILFATLELTLTQHYNAVENGKVLKSFRTMNAEAQCEQFVKWRGLGGKCVKRR